MLIAAIDTLLLVVKVKELHLPNQFVNFSVVVAEEGGRIVGVPRGVSHPLAVVEEGVGVTVKGIWKGAVARTVHEEGKARAVSTSSSLVCSSPTSEQVINRLVLVCVPRVDA